MLQFLQQYQNKYTTQSVPEYDQELFPNSYELQPAKQQVTQQLQTEQPKQEMKTKKPKQIKNVLKKRFNEDMVLLQATLLPVNDTKRNKQFKVKLIYREGEQGKPREATVWFGDKTKQFFFQHQNRDLLRFDVSRYKPADIKNIFASKFWDFHILNNIEFPDIKKAWTHFVINHILK